MIIPGYAVLSLFSPAPELQGPREEGSSFGQLLMEVEHPTPPPLDQEAGERRALESVLQVLMTMFQAFTPAHPAQVVSVSGAGEASVASVGPAVRPAFGGAFGLVPTSELEEPGVNLPLGLVIDASPNTAPQGQQKPVPAVEGSNSLPASALAYDRVSLIQRAQQPIIFSILDRGHRSPVGLTQPGEALTASPEGLSPKPAEPPPRMTNHASPRVLPIEFQSIPELARSITTSLLTGDKTFQSPSVTSQLSSWAAAPAAPGMIYAAAPPLAEAPVSLLAFPQTDAAAHAGANSSGLPPMVIAEAKAAFSERDQAPAARRTPESDEHAPESTLSMAHLTADHAFSSSLTRATSHLPSADSDTPVQVPRHPLEDLTDARQWSRPLPANTVLLHLEPRELGALLVQVHVSAKRLIASFWAQSAEAEALLRTHLPALHESLSQQGFEVQPIAITQAAEEFSTHLGAGTGAFAQQHSAFQAFTQDQHAASTADTQSEVEIHRTPRWPAEQRARLLDVVI
jgi:hypothetical protein